MPCSDGGITKRSIRAMIYAAYTLLGFMAGFWMADILAHRKPRRVTKGLIRLACVDCDTTEADGVFTLPSGWTQIEDMTCQEPDCDSDWWTHLGYCPECSKRYLP